MHRTVALTKFKVAVVHEYIPAVMPLGWIFGHRRCTLPHRWCHRVCPNDRHYHHCPDTIKHADAAPPTDAPM